MTSNAQFAEEFSVELDRFAKKIEVDTATVIRRIALDLFTRIVEKTPVDSGAARASWQISVNRVSDRTFKGGLSSEQATAKAMQQTSKLSRIKGGEIVYISNNVPYAIKLEYGGYGDGPKTSGGYSRQAPRGMVRISLAEVEANLKATLREAGWEG